MNKTLLASRTALTMADAKTPDDEALEVLRAIGGEKVNYEDLTTIWDMAKGAADSRVTGVTKLVMEYIEQADKFVTITEATQYVMERLEG